MCSNFKPSDPLAKVADIIGKIPKRIIKQDHINIVGGPGNSLDRLYHYSIENDLNFISLYATYMTAMNGLHNVE
jgi:hypothetical protein